METDMKAELRDLHIEFNTWQKAERDAKAQMEYILNKITLLEQELEEEDATVS